MSLKSLKIIFLLLVASAIVGCAATDTGEMTEGESDGSMTAGIEDNGGIEGDELGAEGSDVSSDGSLLESLLQDTTVYFDYDESSLTEEAQSLIAAHADYLNDHSGLAILLEGHTDERGTREYNLALGDLRSEAVSLLLQALGVDQSRITTISLGEEIPAVIGADEESWALNRRVQIIY